MRKIVLSIAIILPILGFSQNQRRLVSPVLPNVVKQAEYNTRTNFPSFLKFDLSKAPAAISNTESNDWATTIFPLRSADHLVFKSVKQDQSQKIYKYQQTFENVPVEYAILNIKELNGKIASITGDFHAGLTVSNTNSMERCFMETSNH